MQTRCPHCATGFRVTREDLSAQRGWVRCGVCREAFDALESLADETAQVDGDGPSSAPLPELGAVVAHGEVAAVTLMKDPDRGLPRSPVPAPDASHGAPRFPPRRAGQRWPRVVWALLAIVAGLSLSLQLLPRYSAALSARLPALEPAIGRLCEYLDCTAFAVSPREAFRVVARDVRPHPERDNVLLMNLTFENIASAVQPLPALQLAMYAADGAPVARGVFAPAQYHRGHYGAGGLLRSGHALHVVLEIAAPATPVRDYEIDFVHP